MVQDRHVSVKKCPCISFMFLQKQETGRWRIFAVLPSRISSPVPFPNFDCNIHYGAFQSLLLRRSFFGALERVLDILSWLGVESLRSTSRLVPYFHSYRKLTIYVTYDLGGKREGSVFPSGTFHSAIRNPVLSPFPDLLAAFPVFSFQLFPPFPYVHTRTLRT